MITVYIYTLENPIDNNIFYVGQTLKPEVRLNTHIIDAAGRDNRKKSKIIKSILDNQMLPKLSIIDEITCRYHEDEDAAHNLESYWMHQLWSWGFNLCNVNGLKQSSTYKRRLGRYLEESPDSLLRKSFSSMVNDMDVLMDEIFSDTQLSNLQKFQFLVEHHKSFLILWSAYGDDDWEKFGAEEMKKEPYFKPLLPYFDKSDTIVEKYKSEAQILLNKACDTQLLSLK
jgi:hypothetical protein